MPSIVDVAREAKVAASTVSRVINGSARISPQTQERVREAIRRTGYLPHAEGKRRRSTRAWHMGVLYSPWAVVNGALVHLCRDWIVGIKQAMREAGGNVEIFAGARHVDLDTMYRHSMDHDELHGLILIGPQRDTGYVDDALSRAVPVVLVGDRAHAGGASSVYASQYDGGWQAVEHLLNLGHRRIALGNLPTGVMWSSDQRRKGAMAALRHHGLDPVMDRQADPDFDDVAYFDQAARTLIESQATALVCSDFAAVRYIEALDRQGVRVPEDVSVVGRPTRSPGGYRFTNVVSPPV